jgi:DNA-binding NarL/FixJ family response regulator
MALPFLQESARLNTQLASRAMVVDDHPIVVDAMVTAILGMRLFDRVESANSLPQAIRALEDDDRCALAILDLHLGQVEARETLLGFRERFPDVPVMVFTGDDSLESITMAFECGARGYATKSSPMQTVQSAIRIVLSGGSYIPPEAMRGLGFSPAPMSTTAAPPAAAVRLSGRQSQVFQLLLQGMPNKVIGARLDMAEGTVKAHMNSIFRVLGVRTRVEAILRARQMGLV